MRLSSWRRVATVFAVALVAGLSFPQRLSAQTGSLQGRITDSTGAAVIGARITVDNTSLRTTPTARGAYTLNGVPVGRRIVRVRSLGFAPESLEVSINSGAIATLDVTLKRAATRIAGVVVTVGSRARHTAAEELAVPVDVYTTADIVQAGSTETSQIVANLSPSVNFPKQAVTDATEIVRPFTLRGLSPDHSLVLINGMRRHQTALLNVFSNGSAPGSSGVDLNAFPSSAIDRIEVLRDGAAAQYGSDAIAGVVNLVLKDGAFAPFVNTSVGQYRPGKNYPSDGNTVDVNGGVGFTVGRGSLALFGQYLNRNSTNRACPDGSFPDLQGVADSVADCRVVIKRTGVPQPNVHWGDGAERDIHTFANFKLPVGQAGTTELYAFGGLSNREGTGNGFFRKPQNSRNWPEIYPLGFLPEFLPKVIDYSAAAGVRSNVGGWATDYGVSYGYNSFDFNLRHTLNSSLGPSLSVPTAPGPDGILGNSDDPGIPNQTSFDAGALRRGELNAAASFSRLMQLGLPREVNVAFGAAFRRESYEVVAGERASWINGYHQTQDSAGPCCGPNRSIAQAGSSVFQGFAPSDASENTRSNIGGYLDLETNLTDKLLANAAGRFEHYSDFGQRLTGKLATRYQATKQLVLRGAASTGFRAPNLAQSWYSHTTTAIQNGVLVEIGNFPVTNRASRIFGAKPLKEETSVNLSGGLAWSPKRDVNLTVDYYHITIKDRILLGATFDGSSDPVIADILADSGLTSIVGVQFPTNALDTKTDGVDIAANWRVAAGNGAFDFTAATNFSKNKVTRVDPLPAILVGKGSSYTSALDIVTINAIEKNRPDRRSSLTTAYTAGRIRAMGRISDYGKFRDGSLDGLEDFGQKTLVDAELGYRFDRIAVSFGANNVFNVYPDRVTVDANTNNGTFIWPGSSPFGYNGRYIYLRSELQLSR
ncbi:MAG TPA: TonB-dependent receptor [Gemmatimonadaceae bacterium]|nr:TonB-dependent receptor [Gemmatimonadaceae bacterium]